MKVLISIPDTIVIRNRKTMLTFLLQLEISRVAVHKLHQTSENW